MGRGMLISAALFPPIHASGNEKIPWKLFEMQGERKTWWIGASACFESVHDVTNYSLMLLKAYLRADVEKGKVSFS